MMKISQRGTSGALPAMWLRWVALFCMALIGAASTAQLCHSHDETVAVARFTAQPASHDAVPDDGGKQRPASDSSVRCPLCVAMHAALPVLTSLPQIALLAQAGPATQVERMNRVFAWRFEMASRPPPAMIHAA